ncbi:MAG: D-alanyl-D-alanine carboxypeptidase [Oscillospiraceae bacterium]|nr:D-alanyl-D-alanine carboxypeptidase [Oscillospiraceae bacterium]
MFGKTTKETWVCMILVLSMLFPLLLSAEGAEKKPKVRAKSAILVYAGDNEDSDEVIYSRNEHERREPASITKIMTVLLALEFAETDAKGLDAVVTAKKSDLITLRPGGSNAGIQVGEKMSLEDLIYCSMIKSANDACNIIARYVAGSVPEFMNMVNNRLAEIGCRNSKFTDPYGWPDTEKGQEHYTTAHDLYLMIKECMKNQKFLEIAHTERYTVPPTNKTPEGRAYRTTNKLISSPDDPDSLYPYARGIKTGFTNNAGHCLASLAEKDNMKLISVVLGATKNSKTGVNRSFVETKALFEWGFANFQKRKIIPRNDIVASTKVEMGIDQYEVELVTEEALEALVPKNLDIAEIEKKVAHKYPDGITAPVKRGQEMGTLTLIHDGRELGSVQLLASKDIQRDLPKHIEREVKGFFSKPLIKAIVIIVVIFIAGYAVLLIRLYIRHRNRKRNKRGANYRGSRNKRRRL